MRRVGLALGGGGVRGLAHILVLELLDELNLKPSVIAGTSIGAIVGALYASGMSGRSIRELVRSHFMSDDGSLREVIKKRVELLKWVGPPVPEFRRGGVLKPDRFLRHLLDAVKKDTFQELEIPLLVIAADFWAAEEVVIESGELLPAIRASMAIPGVFSPLHMGGRVLVDGGLLNQVPYDHLKERCDITIAVDVGSSWGPGSRELPNVLEALLGAFDIMQSAALASKMESCKPDIYVKPQVGNIHILDFGKAEKVFEQARSAVENLRDQIARMGLCA